MTTIIAQCTHVGTHPQRELEHAMTCELGTPLARLRASMQTIAHSLPAGDPCHQVLSGALRQLAQVSTSLAALAASAHQREPLTQRTTLRTVTRFVLESLDHTLHERVLIGVENGWEPIEVDIELVAAALAAWLQDAARHAHEPVLLHARKREHTLVFTIVSADTRRADAECVRTPLASEQCRLELALAAGRVAALGGAVHDDHDEHGHKTRTLRIPLTPVVAL